MNKRERSPAPDLWSRLHCNQWVKPALDLRSVGGKFWQLLKCCDSITAHAPDPWSNIRVLILKKGSQPFTLVLDLGSVNTPIAMGGGNSRELAGMALVRV